MAEDLVQDIFIKALQAHQDGRRINNLAGWFYATARTTLVDYLRATKNRFAALDENLVTEDNPDLQLHHELSDCLRPFIEQLPSTYRDTMIAMEFQHTPMRTLADSENVSISAIKSRAARARKMLKQSVLDCCRVEMENGIVSDYRKKTTASCKQC